MRVRTNYFASLLAAAATAGAIALAPSAMAAPNQGSADAGTAATSDQTQAHQSCTSLGGTQSECQSRGNAQIYDAPPQVDYFPYAGGGT